MNSEILITIERQPCYGECPVYSAEIYTNGTVIYKGKYWVKVEGERQYKITKYKLEKLVEEFHRINYFSLKNKYEKDKFGVSVTDQTTTITSITLNAKKKRIVNYYGAPEELDELADKIDKISGLSKLIGKGK